MQGNPTAPAWREMGWHHGGGLGGTCAHVCASLCVCAWGCVCLSACAQVCERMDACVCACLWTCVHAWVSVCMLVHVCVHMQTHVCMPVCTWACMCMSAGMTCMCVCACVNTCMCTPARTRVHICTQDCVCSCIVPEPPHVCAPTLVHALLGVRCASAYVCGEGRVRCSHALLPLAMGCSSTCAYVKRGSRYSFRQQQGKAAKTAGVAPGVREGRVRTRLFHTSPFLHFLS